MKKILFLIDNLKGGGAEKAIKIMVEDLYHRGNEPTLVLLENQKDFLLKSDIKLITLSYKMNLISLSLITFKFIRLVNIIKPDIIFVTNSKSQIVALLSKLFMNFSLALNIQVDLTKQYESRPYILFILSKLFHLADTYYFISHGILKNLKNKIPTKPFFVVPNPINIKEIDQLTKERLDEKYKIIFNKPVIINIGRLTKQKSQDILIQAFAKLDFDCNLVILGEGEREKELKNLSIHLNITHKVFFLGFQVNPFKFCKNADLFVLSSLWEGFGNVIIEAMHCGLPIISSNCPSGPGEILTGNSYVSNNKKIFYAKYGILVPTSDINLLSKAMTEVLTRKKIKKYYSNQSKIRASFYDSKKINSQMVDNLKIG